MIKVKCDDLFKIEKRADLLQVDYNKLQFPLELREWKRGDWFIPIGMKGKKKVSDFFTDNKFSIADKENTWILCSGDEIVWIVGQRPDDRYKVTSDTIEVLRIEVKK